MTTSPELACSACQKNIEEQFFIAEEQAYCPHCKSEIFDKKLGFRDYLPAFGFGLAGAALGGFLDFVVTAATDTQWAILALVMGFMVGQGIKKGNGGRGGRLFQFMAVALTYLAISGSLSSLVVKELISPSEPAAAASPAPDDRFPDINEIFPPSPTPGATSTPMVADQAPQPETSPQPEVTPTPKVSETPVADVPAEEMNLDDGPATGLALIISIAIVLIAGLALPIVAVFIDPIAGLFYLLAMWQAASIVKPLTAEGPHSLSELSAEDGEEEESEDALD